MRKGRTMKHRIAAAVVAVLTLGATATMAAQVSRFPDMRADNPHYEDIAWVSSPARGYFNGFADGRFQPDQAITPEQMAKVLSRLPDSPMTRAEFASFIVGGLQRMRARSATTTTTAPTATTTTITIPTATAPPRAQSGAWTGSCEEMYAAMVAKAYNEQGNPEDYRFTPLRYSATRDNLGNDRFGTWDVDITRVTGWYERFAAPTIVLCQGDAKLDNNQEVQIIIWYIINTDGDGDFGYRFPADNHITCQKAGQLDWTVIGYNITYLYDSAHDSDGDKVMCESVLGEDMQVVGDVIMTGPLGFGSRVVVIPVVWNGSRFVLEGLEGRPWFDGSADPLD